MDNSSHKKEKPKGIFESWQAYIQNVDRDAVAAEREWAENERRKEIENWNYRNKHCSLNPNHIPMPRPFTEYLLKISEKALEAIKNDPCSFRYMPEEDKTRFVCTEAVKLDPYNIQYINPQSEFYCVEAARRNGIVLSVIQKENRTPRVCYAAVYQNWRAIAYVPPELYETNPDIWTKASLQNLKAKQYVPKRAESQAQPEEPQYSGPSM